MSAPATTAVAFSHWKRDTMTARLRIVCWVALAAIVAGSRPISAVTLAARTVEAFERYVAETHRQSDPSLTDPGPFLWVDAAGRAKDLVALRAGELVISRL